VSKIRNSNNRRNLCLKAIAAKMLLYLITGDIVELVEKTSDLGNESYELSRVLCTPFSLKFQNSATKYSGSTLRSSGLRYKIAQKRQYE